MGRTAGSAVARRTGGAGGLARDRTREQRKRIIKMCVQKLRDIDDPETVLCRAVLINNTFRTLKTAQRALLRSARRRLERQESSEEEEGEGEREEAEVELPAPDPLPSLRQEAAAGFTELGDMSCDLGCSDTTMVHSLVMPPLLSPHIEDMTNCSFYDTFGPVDLGRQEADTAAFPEESNVPTNLKLTMMKSDLCDVIGEANSNSSPGFTFPKTEFGPCGGQTDSEGALLDTLLTEIGQEA